MNLEVRASVSPCRPKVGRSCRTNRLLAVMLTAAALLLAASQPVRAQTIVYVNAEAAGANNGTSWADAYVDLQDALDQIANGADCPCEVWVARGIYRPDRSTGDRHMSFRLHDDVAIYGGFVGGEDSCDERDPAANETVLSGDLNGDDAANPTSGQDCCLTGEPFECSDEACRAQVVSATKGLCGGSWVPYCASVAQYICCDLCRPTRCDNSLHVVSAITPVQITTVTLDGFVVEAGEANLPTSAPNGGRGAGVLSWDALQPGGIAAIHACIFRDNAAIGGAAISHRLAGRPLLSRCAFVNNVNFYTQGAADFSLGDARFVDCAFIGNQGGALAYSGDGGIERCAFVENRTINTSTLSISLAQCFIKDTVFDRNEGNSVAAIQSSLSNLQLINCGFFGNRSISWRIVHNSLATMTLQNCVFSGNIGKALTNDGATIMMNCTVVNNLSDGTAGLYNSSLGSATVSNSVFSGNRSTLPRKTLLGAQIASQGQLALSYNCIEGWDGTLGGEGNVDLPPMFADFNGSDDLVGTLDDDLRLSPDSPLINGGDPNPPLAPFLDADDHARILYGRIDMGAYEFGVGDFNGDRAFDLADIHYFWACLGGPQFVDVLGDCIAFDFHAEAQDRIDLRDFARLQNQLPADWP